MNASHLIERNTRAHTQDGYTAAHMVVSAHEQTIRELVAELNTLRGLGHTPQSGCAHREMSLGDATVLVEFEITPASGDGWNEPRHERSVAALQVLVNGTWIDVHNVIDSDVSQGWEVDFLEAEDDELEAAAESAAIARREELFA